jgi:hypothetical protein
MGKSAANIFAEGLGRIVEMNAARALSKIGVFLDF